MLVNRSCAVYALSTCIAKIDIHHDIYNLLKQQIILIGFIYCYRQPGHFMNIKVSIILVTHFVYAFWLLLINQGVVSNQHTVNEIQI